ncbi:MAG: phosphoribosyltransferase family protein [Candidatus Omnitrophica bacterium]|nr:phosphoribosyltransferase family protein [Candidatus Omnitrophota bacterium]
MGQIRILSDSVELFRDRKEAGRILAGALEDFKGQGTVILGIPRGGVVVAEEASELLNTEFDIIFSRKISAPDNPELAIGAINEGGKVFLDAYFVSRIAVSEDYIKAEVKRQAEEIARRSILFRRIIPKVSLEAKTVIIVDDGLATGSTMQASLYAVRQEKPARLIAACPVASSDAVEKVRNYCDEVICLKVPEFFSAVGQFYKNFNQTTDEDVVAILKGRR